MGDDPSTSSADLLREELLRRLPSLERLEPVAWLMLSRLEQASPLYGRLLRQHPDWAEWLSEDALRRVTFGPRALLEFFENETLLPRDAPGCQSERLSRLRAFRRRMSMRIAYRDVNGICSGADTVLELSQLADLCIGECLELASARIIPNWGTPWDETQNKPARFCAIALGKLGGLELNFSSDVDLMFVYDGDGNGVNDGGRSTATNPEIFSRVAEQTVRMLQTQTAEGFLFRVDLRLRPEGEFGPIVSSLTALENYYSSSGQTWERLALIKARPVAGDSGLGEELIESVQSFRYPRNPPRLVLQEVAAMKARTEQEIVGSEALKRDIKSGYGGIREIEFRVQSLQLMNAGRNPFLQTNSTVAALNQLARYELLPAAEAAFLEEAYWFLRTVEHRVQMREERQTHDLPEDPAEFLAVARSLGFESAAAFQEQLDQIRHRVHDGFAKWFEGSDDTDEFNSWWTFLTTGKPAAVVTDRIARWFQLSTDGAAEVRRFALGNPNHPVTRELVSRFIELATSLDSVMPGLARPLQTLQRLAIFAETYGTRRRFFEACALNPGLFRVIAQLFDRSEFIFDVLRLHPEILEEVLRPEILRKKNDREVLLEELAAGAGAGDFADWLWHYVKAEQIRLSIGATLRFADPADVELEHTLLAGTVLEYLLKRHDPDGRLALIALGKLGGRELTQGSDLDIMILSDSRDITDDERILRELQRELTHRGPLGSTFQLDLRLRPHGEAGPVIVTLGALERYYDDGSAQDWEKQVLTRARFVAGNKDLGDRFNSLRERLLFSKPLARDRLGDLWALRMRVERERDRSDPPERAIKCGPGGLIDIEFLAQGMQLLHGASNPTLRKTNTAGTLTALAASGIITREAGGTLASNLEFLKRIERNLRRDSSQPTSVIGPGDAIAVLAAWLGFPDAGEFWIEHVRRTRETRRLVMEILGLEAGLQAPSGDPTAEKPS